jgi:UDP-N-acetylmuramoylalanine--D-glutamate ligase
LDHQLIFSDYRYRITEVSIDGCTVKRACVLGLGISGLAAVEFLQIQGYRVIGADSNPHLERLVGNGLVVFSDQIEMNWEEIDLLVVSPGISPRHPIYAQAKEKGIEVIGEVELGLRYLKQPAIGITGTNGKTTVTFLIEHIFNASGMKAKALGNVGDPLTGYLLKPDLNEVIIVELSSFQLETMTTPVFDGGIVLNITPDHLDRYENMEEYARAKCRLQSCIKPKAPFYVLKEIASQYSHLLQAGFKTYGHEEDSDLWTDKVVAKYYSDVEYFLPIRYRELGVHESENALAVWALCREFSISSDQFIRGLETFKKPPHRIEFVEEIDGVFFYDDSKGTNIDAVIQAVKAMRGPVVLIVGGVDKGASYLPWQEHFQGKVKRVIAIGQAAPKIYSELKPYFDMELADTLTAAVERSMCCAVAGDHVLLSPGCSSYDMFQSYAHRGEEFKQSVISLKRRKKS